MSIYADSSALLKRYLDEPDSGLARELLQSDPELATGRHTVVEVRRNLARALTDRDAKHARALFSEDLKYLAVIELDAATCELGATISETTGARSLDALHLAAAQRAGGGEITFLTFDRRQAQVARNLGFSVAGA